jgi:tetratricopeptide (TPR) repeat protein
MVKRNLLILALCGIMSGTVLANTNAMYLAWQNLEYLDFRNATTAFEHILKDAAKGSDEWLEATLGLAVSLHQRQPDTKNEKLHAGELYEEVIAASKGKEIQATALLLRGKLDQYIDYFGDKEDFDGAIGYYKQVLRDWPDSMCADQAALYMAQSYSFFMDKKLAEEGIKELKSWLKMHPDNSYASTQWLCIAQTYRMPLEDLDSSIDATIKAVDAGLPEGAKADNIFWQVAAMADKVGNKDVSKTFYTRIIIEEPRSRYGYMAQQRLIEMGFDAPELIDPFK